MRDRCAACARRTGRAGRAARRRRRSLRLDLGEQRRLARRAGQPRRPSARQLAALRDHRHLVPASGQAVAERVHARARGSARSGRRRRSSTPEVPSERNASPGADDADADRAGGVVAARRRRPTTSARMPHASATLGAQRAGRLAALDERAASRARRARSRRASPATRRARATSSHSVPDGVRHVGRVLAGQAQAQVVLRQQHARDAREDVRLVRRHPQQLRRGEAGHREIAGDRARRAARARSSSAHSRGAAAVVPQDRRAQHAVARVEQRRAVHLPGEADAAHRASARGAPRAQRARPRRRSRATSRSGSCSDQQRLRPRDRRAARSPARRRAAARRPARPSRAEVPRSMPRVVGADATIPSTRARDPRWQALGRRRRTGRLRAPRESSS